jgi:hypothetical protein
MWFKKKEKQLKSYWGYVNEYGVTVYTSDFHGFKPKDELTIEKDPESCSFEVTTNKSISEIKEMVLEEIKLMDKVRQNRLDKFRTLNGWLLYGNRSPVLISDIKTIDKDFCKIDFTAEKYTASWYIEEDIIDDIYECVLQILIGEHDGCCDGYYKD